MIEYDFIALAPFWKYVLQDAINIKMNEIPIILSDSIFTTDDQREKILEFLFESVGTPAVYLAKKPMLDAFSVGQSTALVFESGASMTSCIPIVDGYPLLKGIYNIIYYLASQKCNMGGDFIDNLLYEKLKDAGTPIPPRYETQLKYLNKPIPNNIPESFKYYSSLNVAREMKETTFSVSLEQLDPLPLQQQLQNPSQNQNQNPSLLNIKQEEEYKRYELPDGTEFNIGPYKSRLPELFFNPTGTESLSVTDLLYQSVSHCPPDLRKDMLSNIFVCGGNSKMKGFCERLSSEIIQKIPENHKVKFISPDERQRTFSTWLGGSILGSLGSFQQMWISKEEFKEKHSFSLLHRGP